MRIVFKKVNENAKIPYYATKGAAGFDICSLENNTILAGAQGVITTGLSMEIPDGYALLILPRSGVVAKNSVTVANSPGLIDSDYRGELKVILANHSLVNYSISSGDRIAQGVLVKVEQALLLETDAELSTTDRGEGGFGSTGK